MNHSKLFVMLALTIIGCLTVCGISVPNQASAAPAPVVSKEFLSFWERFKDALRKNDKNALADMTKLPYRDDEKKLNKAGFIAKTEAIFSTSTRKCLLREKPIADKDSVFVFCGDDIYVFAKDQGKYKFIEIGVND
ncbi:hypothetical protein BH11CYA1_BH11CYA1_10570 [soil metagenome]